MRPKLYLLLTILFIISLVPNIQTVHATDSTETKWVLDRVIVGEGGELVAAEGSREEGSFEKWDVSESSIHYHNRNLDLWGKDDYYDAVFEFSLPVFPAELVPGQQVEVFASGSGSGYLRAGYFTVVLEFDSDDVDLTGTSSSGEEVQGQFGPYINIDIDTQNWDGENWVTTVTDNPSSETVTVRFETPTCDWDQEFSVKIFVWNSIDATVEWFYRCEENIEELEEDPEEIPETSEPTFKVEPNRGNPSDEVTCIGTNYPENSKVTIYWDDAFGEKWERTSDSSGAFNDNITIPSNASKGIHFVTAEAESITLTDEVEVVFKPIIFIPGVGGSQLSNVVAQLWPAAPLAGRIDLALDDEGKSDVKILAPDIIRDVLGAVDVYGSFVDTVISWGYEENKDFFVFPYDWRLDNYDHVEELDKKIDEALAASGEKKVVLVAHSMGGIVARAYMRAHEKFTDKIDSFITMGTPHLGAVKPYYAFLSGYNFDNHLVGNSIMKVIIQNCLAAYQIMPWKPFIEGPSGEWSLEEAYGVKYHSTYLEPRTELIYLDAYDWKWSLNPIMVDEARAFRNRLGTSAPIGIETYTIIGQGRATLSSYTAREPWFYEPYTGIEKADGSRWILEPRARDFGDGDGTVPIWSSSGLQNDRKFYIQDLPGISAAHGSLPASSSVQSLVKNILMGQKVDENDYLKVDFNDLAGDKTGFEIHSSANLHIYDSEGNHMGVNEYGSIEEGITGGTMISMDGYEYCSILNSQDSYDIEVVGFEEGNFTLDVVIRSGGETFEYSYPEIDVVNGSIASFTLQDSQSAKDDPPEMTVQTEDTVLTFLPELIEEQKPVEDTTTSTEDTDNDANSGVPGFPILSILLATLLVSYLLNKKSWIIQF